jgi:outer membrane cobalamin receptor
LKSAASIFVLVFLLQPLQALTFAQNLIVKDSTTIVDSLKMKHDTAAVRSDSTVIDSVRIRFLPGMGKIKGDIDTLDVFYQTQVLWSDAKYASEIFWKLPGFFYRDLDEAGKLGELNAFGVDGRGIGILFDGRPLNDPVTGTYNFSDLPLEFLDHTEIFSGSDGLLTSSSAAGTALNFVSRSYNSYRPMTKLRFVQDPKGTLLTDGIFTQNVMRGFNLMIGFQRHVTLGRYANADLDAWNVRTRLRYNFSERFNISLTDFYTKAKNGLNRGVNENYSVDLFDENSAYVVNYDAWDRRARHDLTLSSIARIFADSTSTTQMNLYYSKIDREYWDGVSLRTDSTMSAFWGMRVQQNLAINPVRLIFGGQIERRKCDSTRTLTPHIETEKALFAQAELRLTDLFILSVSVRSTSLDGVSTMGTGAGFKSNPADWICVSFDASWFDRFPTLQEKYWKDARDTAVIRFGDLVKEQHKFLKLGFDLKIGENVKANVTAYQRTINNAIAYRPAELLSGLSTINISNIDEVRISGLNGSAEISWHQFEALGIMTLTQYKESDTIKTPIPDIILSAEASYRDKFLKEKLEAKFGARIKFYNRQQSMQFDPQTLSYVQYRANILGRSTTIDLFMILKIGDAHISLSGINLLGAGYLLSPIYPMQGWHMRLGLNWQFLD